MPKCAAHKLALTNIIIIAWHQNFVKEKELVTLTKTTLELHALK
jgi:hypothetical protein